MALICKTGAALLQATAKPGHKAGPWKNARAQNFPWAQRDPRASP